MRSKEGTQGSPVSESDDTSQSLEMEDEKIYFSPEYGNVLFASAMDGWAFR